MNNVYILGGLRSYIGICNGIYKHIPAEILGAQVLKKIVQKYELNTIDYIIGGNGVGAGGNITRLMALEAGMDNSIPAFTVDMQCCSGLASISVGADKIKAGNADLIIAGGFESSSTQPRRSYNPNHPDYKDDTYYSSAKFIPHVHRENIMLEGAELTAQKEHITKEEMDFWVLRSHKLALEARINNYFKDITVSINNSKKDDGIRPRMSQKLLDKVPKILPNGKFITAANACLINDGAAFVVLCSEKYLNEHHLKPIAKIINSYDFGVEPMLSPKGAITSLNKILQKNDLKPNDIDIFEINEAFAVIDVLFARNFKDCIDRYNIFGGALAYGHPYGASGAIILLHLLTALNLRNGKLGCATIAGAGGLGSSMLIERI